jgi:hypothetical protein
MSLDECLQIGRVYAIKTKAGVYLCAYLTGVVGVRILSDPTGTEGSWVEREPVSEDWRHTAHLIVSAWEKSVKVKTTLMHSNRNLVWAHALKEGNLILDTFLGGKWFCTVFQPLEVC